MRGLPIALAALVLALPALAATFPPATYPAPVAAGPGHALALCPSPSGLEPFTAAEVASARREAAAYGRRSLQTDLVNADRAWWPGLRKLWRAGKPKGMGGLVVLGAEPTSKSAYAVFIRPACGRATLQRSLTVTVGPSQKGAGPHCDACNLHLFFVARHGKPLVYYLY